jgi:uncharacterized protein DUF2513
MKRDLDLIRRILIATEDAVDYSLSTADLVEDEHDERSIARHVYLLQEAGLLQANVLSSHHVGGAQSGTIDRLTWAGHEFLATARNDTLWTKAKHVISGKIGGIPFELLRAWLMSQASHQLGLPGA